MFDYLQQFNKLPKDLRDRVSSPSAMATIAELENKYRVDLAATVMKIMVKSIAIRELVLHLTSEQGLPPDKAQELAREMKEKLFSVVADHLGLAGEQRALDLDKDISVIIKEAGLVLPSAVLISRFKNILSTYLRGVRSKIDTRNSLAKDAKIGGLNLSPEDIDRIFRVCAARQFRSLSVGVTGISPTVPELPRSEPAKLVPAVPVSSPSVPPRLAEIMAGADQAGSYDLKKAISKRLAKEPPPPVLDTDHELSAPAPQLDLPGPKAVSETPLVPVPLVPASSAKTVAPSAAELSALPPRDKAKIPKPIIPITAIPASVPDVPVTPPPPPPPPPPRPATSRPAPAPSPRPQMHDIRPMPKVMGPIEELQFLDVVNFRRLGTTPAEAVNKIFAKIKLLEKDGYDKMVSGVKAWRQSPTNRLYLRLGQEAVAKGKIFKDVLEERRQAGQECLSQEEVQAIVSLNAKLVF